jgi:integrase
VFTVDHIRQLQEETRNGRRQFARDVTEYPFLWTYSSGYKRFIHFCGVTGLPHRGLHNFRHTVITNRLARGVPIHAVAALAAHSSTSVTDRRYNHTTALNFAHFIESTE